MKNFVSPGDNLTVAAPAAVSSGDVVIVGEIVGIALTDAANGADVAITRKGVFTLAKATGAGISAGAKVYWSTGNSNVTATATANTFIGYAPKASVSADTETDVLLVAGGA